MMSGNVDGDAVYPYTDIRNRLGCQVPLVEYHGGQRILSQSVDPTL